MLKEKKKKKDINYLPASEWTRIEGMLFAAIRSFFLQYCDEECDCYQGLL
jgi:hypothetical protein